MMTNFNGGSFDERKLIWAPRVSPVGGAVVEGQVGVLVLVHFVRSKPGKAIKMSESARVDLST